jgi:hypothetical protein
MWYATTVYLFELIMALVQVEPLLPYPMFVIGGLGRFLDFGDFNYYIADFMIWLVVCAIHATMMMFVYRYSQCAGNFMHKLLTNWKICFVLHPATLVVPTVTIILPLHTIWASQEEIKSSLKSVDFELYKHYEERIIIGTLVRKSMLNKSGL